MRRFERQHDGTVIAIIETAEVALLQTLAYQATGLIGDRENDDPAVRRLLPDAYPDDPEASAEFRRFTQGDLVGRKLAHMARILDSLDHIEGHELRLSMQDVPAWLRALTDLRIILATRLGIERDGDEDRADIDPMMRDVYDWLGFVQNSLVEAIDA